MKRGPVPSVSSSLFRRGLRSSSECILVPTPAREGLFKNPLRMEGLFARNWDFPSFAAAVADAVADAVAVAVADVVADAYAVAVAVADAVADAGAVAR